ncbi:hypothetical protein [Adhaeribacter pallidiroseus]|nr:hypothetical protein [Adhaeribacter pallidiroseus]
MPHLHIGKIKFPAGLLTKHLRTTQAPRRRKYMLVPQPELDSF